MIKLFFILVIFISVFISLKNVFAENCSSSGYTVLTINGIFIDEIEAIKNAYALQRKLDSNIHNSEPLTVDYLHNESHLGGIGDVAKVVYQKIFDNETVKDYDLVEMLKSASDKVKTQKILLVAHSQGNFYANSFYDTVAGKDGGVPTESIGVYSVATPSGRVAGGGKWLTSDTDKIIADLMAMFPFKKIMSPNTSIVLRNGDDSNGHNFSGVYLKYRGKEIVSDIKNSLDKLKTDNTKDPQKNCIEPFKLTLSHKITGAVFTMIDPFAETGMAPIVFIAQKIYSAGMFAVNLTINSFDYIASAINFSAGSVAQNEIKTELIAENIVTYYSPETDKITLAKNLLEEISRQINNLRKIEVAEAEEISVENSPPEIINNIVVPIREIPRILFVGVVYPGFGGGGGVITQTESQNQNNNQNNYPQSLSVPNLSVLQCDYSLASDGCLLATTTISFSWATVSGTDYYAINKNGEYATTTELFFSATIADFSDYIFSVSAINFATTSATSTQTISVATIPVAINEVAWMGTTASAYDEWLELRNNTGHMINLSQWAIESQDGAPYIALSGNLAPYEYRILERRDDTIIIDSLVSTYGNGTSQWALGNSGEELTLYFASTTLDKTPAIFNGSWIAGDNSATTSRKTMERIDSKQSGATTTNWTTWGTNVDFIKNGEDADGNQIFGTPGECNSAGFTNINNGQTISNSTTLEANNCYYISSGVRVSASSTLTIEEGARVSLFQSSLYVDGILDVNGVENNQVVFDSFSNSASTNRIRISGSSGTSTISNALIENTGGIYLNNRATAEITDSDFINNRYGVELNNGSSVVVENSTFASTTNEAISAYNGSVVEVASSTIRDTLTSDAVGIYDSNLTIASSTIINVLSGDGMGLYNSTTTLDNVVISNVSGEDVAIYGGSVIGL